MSTASNVTLRTDIGRPLYYEEVDTNFQELKYVIVESNDHIASTTAHDASDIVYSNANLSASNVEEALNALGVKNNLSATSDPTVNNDTSEGYAAFSRWVNTSTTECFLCLDSVNGAAVWVKSSLTLDELGTAALVDMGVNPSQIRTNAENDQTFVKSTVIFDALSSEATGDGAALISMEGGPTVEDAVLSKANQATTYTETEVDELLDAKADQATTYTETEVNALIAAISNSVGDVVMFAGNSTSLNKKYEQGWRIADGTDGTPNLMDAFPKFGTFAQKSGTGGAKNITPSGSVEVSVENHTLSIAEMPSHNHSTHKLVHNDGYLNSDGDDHVVDLGGSTGYAGSNFPHNHGGSGSFSGSSHTNEPQFTYLVPLYFTGVAGSYL